MTDSFVLVDRPWIPCERVDGSVVELSTHDALIEAHRLRGIVDSSPLVPAVLVRHLLAVVHRVVAGPTDFQAWADVVRRGHFDPSGVATYLAKVRDRMDLFHPERPFAQVRGLVEQFHEYLDPIDQLGIERSNWGGARSLFQHRPPHHVARMSPAEAARSLLVHHAFATGGLVKKPNEPTSATAAPLVRSGVIVVKGVTLFETLTANLLPYAPELDLPFASQRTDAPAWEQPSLPRQLRQSDEPKRAPLGWLDLLTWTSRRIELVRRDEWVASYVRAVGQGLAEQSGEDPMVAYRLDDKRGRVSLGIDPDKAFWRNAHALFESAKSAGRRHIRPKTLDHIGSLEAQDVIGPRAAYQIEMIGIAAEKSRLDAVRSERVWTLARHLDSPDARGAIESILAAATASVGALRSALWTYARHLLSEGDRDPATADVSNLVTSLHSEPALWAALGVEFDVAVRAFDRGFEEATAAFTRRAIHHAREALTRATSGAEDVSRSLKARALADRSLAIALADLTKSVRTHTNEESHHA
jgi:CRISPR system Cascade subunit CasA